MPPSRRSSGSHSSRSHRSSSSLSHRSSSHSSSSYRSSGCSSSGHINYVTRERTNQPTHVPRQIQKKAVCMHCRNHDYMYYDTPWQDEKTGVSYQKGYYDETGKYYDANEITFKRPDGFYTAHYICDYCGTESENTWREGFYPTCKNCGAQMEKQPIFVDDIISIEKYSEKKKFRQNRILEKISQFFIIFFSVMRPVIIFIIGAGLIIMYSMNRKADNGAYKSSDHDEQQVTNLDIYGDRIYLIDVGNHTYEICDPDEPYDKCLEWDYGADSYYDYESNCYLWYNTDVAPNLWQYWYDDIAGGNYYGWMECEKDT